MVNRNKEKGSRLEMAACKAAELFGMRSWRVAGSGNIRGGGEGDVQIKTPAGQVKTYECKCKKSGFKFLYDNLGNHDGLILHEVNKENCRGNLPHMQTTAKPKLIVLRLDDYLELLAKAGKEVI